MKAIWNGLVSLLALIGMAAVLIAFAYLYQSYTSLPSPFPRVSSAHMPRDVMRTHGERVFWVGMPKEDVLRIAGPPDHGSGPDALSWVVSRTNFSPRFVQVEFDPSDKVTKTWVGQD